MIISYLITHTTGIKIVVYFNLCMFMGERCFFFNFVLNNTISYIYIHTTYMLLQHFIIIILIAARYSANVYFLKPAYISN